MEVHIACIFNTYGPKMCIDDDCVVRNLVAQAMCQEPLTVYVRNNENSPLTIHLSQRPKSYFDINCEAKGDLILCFEAHIFTWKWVLVGKTLIDWQSHSQSGIIHSKTIVPFLFLQCNFFFTWHFTSTPLH